jgi:hypothetical protein
MELSPAAVPPAAGATGVAGNSAGSTPVAGSTASGASGQTAGRGTATGGSSSSTAGTGTPSAAAGTNGPSAGAGGNPPVAPAAGSGEGAAGIGQGGAGTPSAAKVRRAVSADFLNKTLSIVDIDKLKEGATRADALLGMVDLSMYTPGPLAVAVTPDGKTAVVSISGGWLGLVTDGIPAGDGIVVFVDLETLKVTGELDAGAAPMGIAITHDGKHAFIGLMSETYMAYVDIEKKTFERIATGNSWNEEVAIDDTGTIGMLTTGVAGNALSFSVATPTTNGITAGLTGDAGGVAFFPGTKRAFIVQAPTALTGNTGGYNVIDATDPNMPRVLDSSRVSGDTRQAYPVTPVPSRKSVVFPFAQSGKLTLVEMALEGDKAKVVQMIPVGDGTFSYGLTAGPDGLIYSCVGTEHYVAVVDLNTAKAFTVPWGTTAIGPLDIRLIP